jgi:hypothetical protein
MTFPQGKELLAAIAAMIAAITAIWVGIFIVIIHAFISRWW